MTFFDETHARSIGLNPTALKIMFFTLLSASTVAALQTVGAFLVICMVVTPGATAYLLTDRFPRLLVISVAIGSTTSFVGAYASYFLDGATGGIIVVLQTLAFLAVFFFAPKHGMLAARRRAIRHWRQAHDATRYAPPALPARVHALCADHLGTGRDPDRDCSPASSSSRAGR